MANIQSVSLTENTVWGELLTLPPGTKICVDEPGFPGVGLESRIKQISKDQLRHLGKISQRDRADAPDDDFAFECLWGQALTSCSIHWKNDQSLDVRSVRKIMNALERNCIFNGKGIEAKTDHHNLFHPLTEYLLGRNNLPDQMTSEEALGLFHQAIEDNSEEACRLLQQELKHIFEDAFNREFNRLNNQPGREDLFKMFIGHIVSLLPFAYPNTGDIFPIPVKIDGQWVMKNYKIDERIELTPGPFTPLLGFGLVAEDDPHNKAPPLMTLSGTTWGEGRFISILSDLTPFMSVGHVPYLFGQSKIDSWIDKHSTHQDVHLYGASLGGALCLHVLRNHRNRVASVNIYNPPGLYPFLWKGPFDGGGHEVNIYLQQNDIVSNAGYFPTGSGVHVYRIIGERSEGWREAHRRSYGGGNRVTLIQSSAEFENTRWNRTAWTGILFVAGITVGAVLWTFYLLACLYHVIEINSVDTIEWCKRNFARLTSPPWFEAGAARGLILE